MIGQTETLGNSLITKDSGGIFRVIIVAFYAMTILFSIIYFSLTSIDDIEAGRNQVKSTFYIHMAVVLTAIVGLTFIEFYKIHSLAMKIVKLLLVLTVAVFVFLSFKHVTDMIDVNNATTNPGVALIYTFASLTLGFAGVSSLFNMLDMLSTGRG